MKSNVTKNTLTNYLVVAVRFLQGIFVTRWTISYLGTENYGLWAVLWTIFAYSLLLDFGFGASAQKYTGMGIYQTDIKRYNRVLSAIWMFHLAMAAIILLISFGLSFFVGTLFDVHDPEKLAYCRSAFLLFACGSALVFPTTMFPEVAVGQQKHYLRNYVNLAMRIIELFGTLLIFKLGGQVRSLTMLTLGLTFFGNITIGFLALRDIPGFRFTLQIGWATYREIGKFSGFVYMASIARLLMNRSSRLIISFFLGLTATGLFHMASRLPDLCFQGAAQYQENIRPITARLYHEGKTEELQQFILRSLRINLWMGLFFFLPAFLFVAEALRFLFKIDNPEVFYLSKWALASMFSSIAVRQIVQGYLIMSESHRILSYVTVAEAVLNVGLNCALIKSCGVVVILINSMAIQFLVTIALLFPVTIKKLRLPVRKIIFSGYLPPLLAAIPGAFAAWLFQCELQTFLNDFWMAALGSSLFCGIFALLSYFLVLTSDERAKVVEKLRSLIFKGR